MRQSFDRPVTVLVGLGMPVDVGTVMEAYALLNDWPPSQRNPTHAIALNACKAALMDLVDAETARATFVAFARKNDLLVERHDALPGRHHTRDRGRGRGERRLVGPGRTRLALRRRSRAIARSLWPNPDWAAVCVN